MPTNPFHLLRIEDMDHYLGNRIHNNDSYKTFLAMVLDSVIEGIITAETARDLRHKATRKLDSLGNPTY